MTIHAKTLPGPKLDPKQICFISCVNDEAKYDRCRKSLESLKLPSGMRLEIKAIRGAKSMAAGYQAAMADSRAKYKIYLHQDVVITQEDFLLRLVAAFRASPSLGILGLCGTPKLPAHGVWWDSHLLLGKIADSHTGRMETWDFGNISGPWVPAEALDGLLLATQYDLPWREDVFDGFHFYDLSQCQEFLSRDLKVGILKQDGYWVEHDCGYKDNTALRLNYDSYRRKFIETYQPQLESQLGLLEKARQYLAEDLEDAAEAAFQEVLLAESSSPDSKLESHYRLAQIYHKKGRNREALSTLYASVALGYRAEICVLIAQLMKARSDSRQSITWYRSALNCIRPDTEVWEPECWDVIPLGALIEHALQEELEVEEGLQYYNRLKELAPRHPQVRAYGKARSGGRKKLMFFWPGLLEVHFVKDIGMIPYIMGKYLGWDVAIVTEVPEQGFEFPLKYPSQLEVIFSPDRQASVSHLLDADVVMAVGLYDFTLDIITKLKEQGSQARLYVKLDLNVHHFKRLSVHKVWIASLLQQCDLVTIESRSLQKIMEKEWGIKTHYLAHGYYDLARVQESPIPVRKKEILTVGRLGTHQKNTELLLEAFLSCQDHIGDWNLVLVGPVETSLQQVLDGLFQKNPKLRERIQLKGELDFEGVQQSYREASIFCLTSRWEGCANVIGEAIGGGCYLVSSDVTGAYSLLEQGILGEVFPSEDANALEAALLKACLDPELLARAHEEHPKLAQTKLSWITLCKTIESSLGF